MVPSSFFWQCLCQSTLRGANPLEPNPYPRLVGITTDWHQRRAILAGTRIWCFIKCITMNNPDLIRLMPVEGDAWPMTNGGDQISVPTSMPTCRTAQISSRSDRLCPFIFDGEPFLARLGFSSGMHSIG